MEILRKILIGLEVTLGLVAVYFAYLWYLMPESNILEPKNVLTVGIMTLVGFALRFIPKNDNAECPYDSKLLHSNHAPILNSTFEKLKNELFEAHNLNLNDKLLSEKNGNNLIYLPAIILTREEIKISETLSNTRDTNVINENFINILQKQCGHKLWNNPTYRLMNIDTNEHQLVIGHSDYFKTLSTCDFHYYNFMKKNSTMINGFGEEYENWFLKLKDIIINNQFTTVSASLGCSTLLIVKNYDTNIYEYFIVDNSKTKNAKDTKHVIPAFMFQPTKQVQSNNDFKLQADIKIQVLKEFAEELLGMEELERVNDYKALTVKMKENKVLKLLNNLLENGEATFKILGVSLDIYRLRPEILTTLIIDNEKFYKQFNKNRKLSWEASEENLDGLGIYDIEDEQQYLNLIFDKRKPLVSPGAACLKLGREYMLNKYLKR